MSAFSLTAIQEAFASYLTASGVAGEAKAALTGLGPFPLFPLEITTNTDYTTVANAQATWLTAYAADNAALQSALTAQRTAELAVISTIQSVTTAGTVPEFGANQWYEHSDSEHWFGYSDTDMNKVDGQPYLVVETTLPPKPFAKATS